MTCNVARLDQHASVNLGPAMHSDPPSMPGGRTLCLGQTPLLGFTRSSELIQGRGVRPLLVLALPPPPRTRSGPSGRLAAS
jgi:hypothetical protein